MATHENKEIRDIAEKTFLFVRVHASNSEFSLEKIEPFWTDKKWAIQWDERNPEKKETKRISWRNELGAGVSKYNNATSPAFLILQRTMKKQLRI